MKQIKITARLTNRDNDSFKQYLRDISEIDSFTPEEELICAEKASKGDKVAREELVTRNLRFVVSVAKQYATPQIPLEDLVNEGNIGLIMAAERFKTSEGVKFISYGVWWIRKIIMEHISKNGRMVRLPANKINSLSKLDKHISELEQANGYEVDIQEVFEKFGGDEDFMFLDVLSTYKMDSLDREISSEDGGGATLLDVMVDSSAQSTDYLVADNNYKETLNKCLDVLKPRDKRIMELLFGLDGKEPRTLKEVSDEVGITREMVRQVKQKSLVKLSKDKRVQTVFNEL
jgi:RNA polymerase primary sigma factor